MITPLKVPSPAGKYDGMDFDILKKQLKEGIGVFHQKWLQSEIDIRYYKRELLKPIAFIMSADGKNKSIDTQRTPQIENMIKTSHETCEFYLGSIHFANEILNEINELERNPKSSPIRNLRFMERGGKISGEDEDDAGEGHSSAAKY
jgi:hypothetical protein